MAFRIIRSILLLVVLALLVTFFDHKVDLLQSGPLGSVPPPGRFFDPFHGIWENAARPDSDSHLEINLNSLTGTVQVVFDAQRIPHLFAGSEHDLFFVQGYLTARDRLWQMEFQTLAAAGRVSEIIGPKALSYDRYQRRLGMVYGAEKSLESMMKDPVSRRILLAYTEGVNAWIDQLKPADYAIEYKILDYRPERWSTLKCMLLLKSMAATLSAESDAAAMTANRQHFGPEVINDLFPDYPFKESPVIPEDTRWDFEPVRIKQKPGSFPAKSKGTSSRRLAPALGSNTSSAEDAAALGSNNWALAGSRTKSGFPILANDPHLSLSLPSIWYAVQLTAPGLNVEGVSLPGAPGVIIGFNQHITWGVTNVGASVMDFYRLQWKDGSKTQYAVGGVWVNATRRIEHISVRGKPAFTDTVIYTRDGPVVQDKSFPPAEGAAAMIPADVAVHWTAHEGFNEVRAFYEINKAEGYDQFVSALDYFGSPGQNFAYADDKKNIALWVNGKFPLKYKDQGKYILDARDSADNWKGWIPHDQLPQTLNPKRGFVSSANQSSTAKTYPYYLNWQFGSPYRGIRINSLLGAMHAATADSMRTMQNDTRNTYASMVLPLLLSQLDVARLSPLQKKAFSLLKSWNLENQATEPAPAIFDLFAKTLEKQIWDEFDSTGLLKPNRDRTLKLLLTEPNSPWYDLRSTSRKENRADIIQLSFRQSVDSLSKSFGADLDRWQWYAVKGTSVMHLLKIDAFSKPLIHNGGGSGIISAMTHRTGPSWRMVVQTGKKPQAFGVYPGGQSGNPGSRWYDNMLDPWSKGESYNMSFWHVPADNPDPTLNTITFKANKNAL